MLMKEIRLRCMYVAVNRKISKKSWFICHTKILNPVVLNIFVIANKSHKHTKANNELILPISIGLAAKGCYSLFPWAREHCSLSLL